MTQPNIAQQLREHLGVQTQSIINPGAWGRMSSTSTKKGPGRLHKSGDGVRKERETHTSFLRDWITTSQLLKIQEAKQ